MRHARSFLLYFIGILAVALTSWIDRMFGAPTIDQVLFHLRFAEEAAVQMSEVFVSTFLVEVLGVAIVGAALAAAIHARFASTIPGWPARLVRAAPHLVVVGGLGMLLAQFSVFSYAAAQFEEDRFAGSYRAPVDARLTETGRRNLILVYVESLEETYADSQRFGADLLAPLRVVGGQSLPAYRAAPGATWTIAAMVGTQCGVPLASYTDWDFRDRDGQRTFLAGATCLGDILKERGYRNVFMGGAHLTFAGKGRFLQDHGYQEAWGRDEWRAAGARRPGSADPELGGWGLYDDALFARARDRLVQLHEAGQPFNLTLLTLDTHNPNGYQSPRCRGDRAARFTSIVGCTTRTVAEFVRFVREKGYLKDTALVIIGDHLAVGNPVEDALRRTADRRVFNLFLGAEPFPPDVADAMTFDMFPTLLEATGMRTQDGRLGLGRSVWSPQTPPADWVRHPNLPGLAGSSAYRRLWALPDKGDA